jgi:hypothetical protein
MGIPNGGSTADRNGPAQSPQSGKIISMRDGEEATRPDGGGEQAGTER